jgi:iron complex outermembrane receptor protein
VFDTVDISASTSKRSDLDPESITNPYRVESTARFGTEIISRKEIESSAAKNVFDLLGKATGMNLTYQGRRSPFFLDNRGGGQLTYILDGAVLPPSYSRILQKIPLADIEEIEIVRGATSLSLGPTIGVGAGNTGSGLNTGFVVLRTRRPQKTEGVFSTYAETSNAAPVANGQSIYSGVPVGGHESNIKGYLASGLSRYNRPGNSTWFDASDGRSAMINGGIDIGRFTLALTGYFDTGSFQMQRGRTIQGTLDTSKWYYDPLDTSVLTSDMTMKWSDHQVTIFSAFTTTYEQTEHNELFTNTDAQNALLPLRHYKEKSNGYSLRHHAQFGSTLVQLGGQITGSSGFGPNLSSAYNNYDTTIRGWTVAVEQTLPDETLCLDAGFRQDVKHIDLSSTSASNNAVSNNVDMAPANTVATGIKWKYAERYALSARCFYAEEGTGGDFDLRTQNSTLLHPEVQNRYEIAIEARPSDWLIPVLTWFDYDIKNQKSASTSTYVVDGQSYYYYTESDAHRRGLELTLKGGFAKHSSYTFSWTHLIDDATTSSAGVTTDAIGVAYPENMFTASISHEWKSWQTNLTFRQAGSWQTTTSPLGTLYADLGDYTTFDANIVKEFPLNGRKLTTTLYVRNIGNEHYSTRYVTGYYPDRGRTAGLALSMIF